MPERDHALQPRGVGLDDRIGFTRSFVRAAGLVEVTVEGRQHAFAQRAFDAPDRLGCGDRSLGLGPFGKPAHGLMGPNHRDAYEGLGMLRLDLEVGLQHRQRRIERPRRRRGQRFRRRLQASLDSLSIEGALDDHSGNTECDHGHDRQDDAVAGRASAAGLRLRGVALTLQMDLLHQALPGEGVRGRRDGHEGMVGPRAPQLNHWRAGAPQT